MSCFHVAFMETDCRRPDCLWGHKPSAFRLKPKLRFFMAAKDSRMRSVALPATAWARAAAVFAPNLRLQQILFSKAAQESIPCIRWATLAFL